MATLGAPDSFNKIDSGEEIGGNKQEIERGGEMNRSDRERDGEMHKGDEESGGEMNISEGECNSEEADEDEETEDEETEDEAQYYWDCCRCIFKTENNLQNKRCLKCRHRRCKENCMEYKEDEDDMDGYKSHDMNKMENTEGEKVARCR